ncbi:MAG: hypothetical protein KDA21_13085, partial [Phycisphaerales bacterium]|nr:hypothetical protein [Phycisphaerales bacterium]
MTASLAWFAMPSSVYPSFDDHCREAVLGIRSALLDLYTSVGADAARPQDVARQFGLNKNLTWKVARILGTDNAFEAVPLIPGSGGLDILLNAMAKAGAPERAVRHVREAVGEFDQMVEIHTGDRATLELALDSMAAGWNSERLERSRKMAFLGTSGLWGAQARVRLSCNLIAPNDKDPDRLDLALVGGIVGFRRLRAGTTWPLFRIHMYRDDGSIIEEQSQPIDPRGDNGAGLRMLPDFCTAGLPEIGAVRDGQELVYELADGPVGNLGTFDCFFGEYSRASVPRHRDESNRFGELGSLITMPIETLIFDLLVHRDLEFAANPEVLVFGCRSPMEGGYRSASGSNLLPIPETVHDIGHGPPNVATPL